MIPQTDLDLLARDKYAGDASQITDEDRNRLEKGEPLAYVIGHIPFLGLSIGLSSRPLIPRPETEWWTEELINYIGSRKVKILDLCAGSGATGLAVAKHCENARVSFGEIEGAHVAQIKENVKTNNLDVSRVDIQTSDLFAAFTEDVFDIITTNPPYIPEGRKLPESVKNFEPTQALYAGEAGLGIIKRILEEASRYLREAGELWMECDVENIEEAKRIAEGQAARTLIRNDQYGRPRLLVGYYL